MGVVKKTNIWYNIIVFILEFVKIQETKIYNAKDFVDASIALTIKEVVEALEEKGYNPINQIVGYLMSGDPGYISSYKESRKKITKLDRAKVLEVLVKYFIS